MTPFYFHQGKYLQSMLILILITLTACQNTNVGSGLPPTPGVVRIEDPECALYYIINGGFQFLSCIEVESAPSQDWASCLSICCPSMPSGDFSAPSLATLKICREANRRQGLDTNTFIGILLASIAGFVLLLCCCVMVIKTIKKRRIKDELKVRTE